MSLGVKVHIDPTQPVIQALAHLALDRADKHELMDEIGVNLSESARLRFSDQHDPDGNPWEPSLRAKTQGGETLRDTGRLQASIAHVPSQDSVEYGTNVLYGKFMHFGGMITAKSAPYLKFRIPGIGWASKKTVKIPARPFLGLSGDDEQQVINIIDGFLAVR